MEKIDILMATYNGEKYLEEQIESILNQTYSNFRLIISDDCSTDRTCAILKEYAQKDNRIELYFQEKNLGYVKNFEFLLGKVENELYMLSDQDDYWLPEKVEKTYNKLIQENVDMVFTDLIVVDEDEKIINKSFNELMNLKKKICKTVGTSELAYLYNCVTGCTIMGKKSNIKNIIPIPTYSKHVLHDHWIALANSINGKVAYLSEGLIKYRQHGTNQIGIKHTMSKSNSVEEIRKHFIDVKLGVFGTYVNNPQIFTEKLRKRNEKAYKYFEMLAQKKNINFRGWGTFYNLYKNESVKYYMENFLILNMPCVVRLVLRKNKKGE
mgnify:FL=1